MTLSKVVAFVVAIVVTKRQCAGARNWDSPTEKGAGAPFFVFHGPRPQKLRVPVTP